MAPPPATPTPHRFLVPKRTNNTGSTAAAAAAATSQRQQTETPKSSLPPLAGHQPGSQKQQFHVTPRFSVHSTPRGLPRPSQQQQQQQPSSTPAPPPSSHYFRSSRTKNATSGATAFDEDVIDSSPPQEDPFDDSDYDENDIGQAVKFGERGSGAAVRGFGSRIYSNDGEIDWIVTQSSPADEEVESTKHRRDKAKDPVLIDDDVDAQYEREEHGIPPSPKRRRISTSSLPVFEEGEEHGLPPLPLNDVPVVNEEDEEIHRISTEDNAHMMTEDDEMDINHDLHQSELEKEAAASASTQNPPPSTIRQQQPTFHKAPRFKTQFPEHHHASASENNERHYDPLPEAFSPSRRNNKGVNKYVSGGLASELRDWLVDMEAATGPKREGDWLARIVVDELETTNNRIGAASGGMYLIYGHHMTAGNACSEGGDRSKSHEDRVVRGSNDARQDKLMQDTSSDHEVVQHDDCELPHNHDPEPHHDPRVMIILAGEGRIAPGIAKRRQLRPGLIIGIARPTWEITLGGDLGRWAVACDWAILN